MTTRAASDSRLIIVGTRLLGQALGSLLEPTRSVTVAGAGSIGEAIAMAREQPPGIMVIHVGTGRSAVDDQLRELMYLAPARRTILLCHGVSPDEIAAAVGLGAGAVISEDCGAEGLLDAFEAMRQGRPYLGRVISDILRGKAPAAGAETRGATPGHLTARERQVLALVAQARTAQEIGALLGMSQGTVQAHRRSIMNKLRVRRTVALVRRAIQLGLVAD